MSWYEPQGRSASRSASRRRGLLAEPVSRSFGFSGNSIAFLADAADAASEPHVTAAAIVGLEGAVTVEGALFLQGGSAVPSGPWSTLARQPGVFALGVDSEQRAWFEVRDEQGDDLRVTTTEAVPEERWVHLTGIYDGAQVRLYVDAHLTAVAEARGRPLAQSDAAAFVIGPRNHGDTAGGHGLVFIDEVGVSPGARPLEEIAHAAFQRVRWPTTPLADWERVWGEGKMPLGLVDDTGRLLAPIHLGFEVAGDAAERVSLGEALFADTALSTTSPAIACESCHTLTLEHTGARRGERTSTIGAGVLTRHTPTVYNRVFGRRQLWDGRAPSLTDQVPIPIVSSVEMNTPLELLEQAVLPQAGYREPFCEAFGTPATTTARLQEAIAFFESGLVSGDSAVDRHRFGGEPLPDAAARGLALFATKGRCIGCHRPPLYADGRFHDNAQGDEGDPGRGAVTGYPADVGRFRTMSLRDVDRTAPYMHDGAVPTLDEVVRGYDRGGDDASEVEMRPLHLTTAEQADIVAFLTALRSERHVFLREPR